MKQLYAACGGITCYLILSFLPNAAKAQCTCWTGNPAAAISYLQTVPATQASSSPFSFPQFDPAIGTLSCISFNDTISVVVTTFGRNTDTTSGHNYVFQTTVSESVNGPRNSGPFNWMASYSSTNKSYGPVWLDKDTTPRLPTDSVVFGPDTLLNNAVSAGSPPDLSPFLGSGSVNFSADLSGGSIATAGGVNYTAGIHSNAWGSFRLTYYWCPTTPLGANISSFSAIKADNNVLLQWSGLNEQEGDSYSVEYSTDGVHFITISVLPAYAKAGAQAAIYQFQYPIPGTVAGQIYFRIEKNAAGGATFFSPIKPIALNNRAAANYQIYPNPSSRHVYVEWQSLLVGDIEINVINTLGQQVYSHTYQFDGSNSISFDLPSNLVQGNYFLMVKDPANNIRQARHLVIH